MKIKSASYVKILNLSLIATTDELPSRKNMSGHVVSEYCRLIAGHTCLVMNGDTSIEATAQKKTEVSLILCIKLSTYIIGSQVLCRYLTRSTWLMLHLHKKKIHD
ncbi:hypothetical protein DAI22_01g326200 [Oryza sativa Japonica Group]|jgi:hypothetical protein|uniref:cDNA clone:001-130-H07, full insert sequence n=1 Tax=Oryza sativa subsp. japonica TaxID=39947 RepID=B7F4R7_ORYSJ|nr:hypothetical protein DAI22_01g326200 [Oryza sativa Japonica Group]KAF2952291.1 hypothetical protein DAI22_01g326200 [Oryza sativa Japonica Group]BAG99614.1 unnamed protein product [Oryza sativa Japonica Group]